jgi:hypothetical protein
MRDLDLGKIYILLSAKANQGPTVLVPPIVTIGASSERSVLLRVSIFGYTTIAKEYDFWPSGVLMIP